MARSEKVTFPGASGATLAGRLDWPEGPPRAFALFAHCFTCSKEALAAVRISRALAARGLAVLRFDFTGLGGSGGEFASTNFSSNVADLIAAADWLRSVHAAPALLVGHSLGGAAVLRAAGSIAEARAVATIAAPADPEHLKAHLAPALPAIAAAGEAEITIGGRSFRIKQQLLDDIAGQKLATAIGALRKALMVLHAPRDEIVGIDNATRIFVAARHPKSFVSLDDADHLLTREADAVYVADVLAAWAGRYLPAPAVADAVADGGVVVTEAGEGRFVQHVAAGRHRLLADEPAASGGNDRGPDPYGFLLAALGACTSMTLRMYADLKTLPLERVEVRLRHEKVHAQDCADCETKAGKVDVIHRAIRIEGPALDAAQRQRLMEIADRCPVHRTLTSEIRIRTVAVE